MIFITIFQFQVCLTWLGVSQMVQSPMGTNLAWERRRRVQSRIFLNQRIDFEYRQLLPGVEMIYLNVCAKSTPLMHSEPSYECDG